MQTIIIEVESSSKAKELSSILMSMNFIKKVSTIKKRKQLIEALEEHEEMKNAIVKKKNILIQKYV